MAEANLNCPPNRRNYRHGAYVNGKRTPEYMIWGTMIQRCENPKNKKYAEYGGRGISVCSRWRKSFADFLADMGERPSSDYQLDRYPNNDGNYEPGNCRWASRQQNTQNTRRNRLLTLNGESLALSEWSRRTGLHLDCLRYRLEHGWSVERALTTKSRQQ